MTPQPQLVAGSPDATTVDEIEIPHFPSEALNRMLDTPVLLLEGPRSVGKSTLFRQIRALDTSTGGSGPALPVRGGA